MKVPTIPRSLLFLLLFFSISSCNNDDPIAFFGSGCAQTSDEFIDKVAYRVMLAETSVLDYKSQYEEIDDYYYDKVELNQARLLSYKNILTNIFAQGTDESDQVYAIAESYVGFFEPRIVLSLDHNKNDWAEEWKEGKFPTSNITANGLITKYDLRLDGSDYNLTQLSIKSGQAINTYGLLRAFLEIDGVKDGDAAGGTVGTPSGPRVYITLESTTADIIFRDDLVSGYCLTGPCSHQFEFTVTDQCEVTFNGRKES